MNRWLMPMVGVISGLVVVGAAIYGWGVAHDGSASRHPLPSVEFRSPLSQKLLVFEAEQVVVAGELVGVPNRNLFQPAATAATDTADVRISDAPAAPAEWIYKGRVLLGNRHVAVLENRANGETFFAGVGEAVGRFRLLDINDETVVLSRGSDDQMVLEIIP